jgi:hypothetical protein
MMIVNEDKLRAMGLRRTGEKSRPQRGQWFLTRDGEPRLQTENRPPLASTADLFELLEPDAAGTATVVHVRCPRCSKTEDYRIVGWPPGERFERLECNDCTQGALG